VSAIPAPPIVQPRKGLAIASMVLGIVSIYPLFFVGFIPGIIAMAFGFNHRNEARRLGHEPSAMGTAGWICGIIGTVIGVLIWIVFLVAVINGGDGNS
jgi:hypothetical protein